MKIKLWHPDKGMLGPSDIRSLMISPFTILDFQDNKTLVLPPAFAKDDRLQEIYDDDIIKLNDGIYIVRVGTTTTISDIREEFECYDDLEYDMFYHHGEALSDHCHRCAVIGNIFEDKQRIFDTYFKASYESIMEGMENVEELRQTLKIIK